MRLRSGSTVGQLTPTSISHSVVPARSATGRPGVPAEAWALLSLMVYVGLIAAYFVVRFGGYWAETDSAAQSLSIRSVVLHASLNPNPPDVYPNGSAYTSVSATILAFTGIDVGTLQHLIYPLTAALLVPPAWALYRELTTSSRAATLAVLVLFTNPEFLFVVLRGSHERMLRCLMLVGLWLLVRGFRFRHRPRVFAAHVVLFYVVTFGLISTNAFFGLSFAVSSAVALALALVLGRVGQGFRVPAMVVARRLLPVTLGSVALAFVFIFYLYPLATTDIKALAEIGNKLMGVSLGSEEAADPYMLVAAGWTSIYAYFLLGIQDYLLMSTSAVIWTWLGIRWLRNGTGPPTLSAWLMWLLYGAFALQGGLAIIADRSGHLGGNLQLRLFPSFAMLAAPLVAWALCQLHPRRPVKVLAGVGAAVLTALALLKATNEPTFSNKWMFHTSAELRALTWATQHHEYAGIWVGPDERLSTAYDIAVGQAGQGNHWDIYEPDNSTRSFIISDVLTLQAIRLDKPLPPVLGENRVYDSGSAQIYRLRPQTPYQR
jgi:hypothetical protein